jgi:hypothetical protein
MNRIGAGGHCAIEIGPHPEEVAEPCRFNASKKLNRMGGKRSEELQDFELRAGFDHSGRVNRRCQWPSSLGHASSHRRREIDVPAHGLDTAL